MAIPADGNVQGAAHVGPHRAEFPVSGEDLDAIILPVAEVDRAGLIDHQAVGQVKLIRPALAWFAP